MAPANNCPSESELDDYLCGRLRADHAADLDLHLDTCPECLARVARRSDGSAVMGALGLTTDTAEEVPPGLIERLESLFPASDFGALSGPPETIGPDLPKSIAHYRVVDRIGAGGMGVVYRAEDTQLRRPVAVKVMSPRAARNPRARDRFLREARAVAALNHDHIVTIYQVGVAAADGDVATPYLAMELLEGEGLDTWMARFPRPPLPAVLRIAREAAAGLAAAHDRGVVHRDVKPANLWLSDRGRHDAPAVKGVPPALPEHVRVKLLDFGLAATSDEQGRPGVLVGTPAYMAPEQARGAPVDARADVFGLGCVLYELCTGTHPFPDRTRSNLEYTPPVPVVERNPDLPPELAELVTRMIAESPADRPASAAQVEPVLGALEHPPVRRAAGSRRKWLVAAGGLAAGGAALVAFRGDWFVPSPQPVPEPPGTESEARLVNEVIEQLKAANPGYNGTADIKMANEKVWFLGIPAEVVGDIGPVRALRNLTHLRAIAPTRGQGKIRDLSPLKGLKLETIEIWDNPGITSFGPLRGMPLRHLDADGVSVAALDDLAGMPLDFLAIDRSRVRDLSVIRGMSQLRELRFIGCDVKNYEPLLSAPLTAVSCDVRPGEAETVLRKHPTIATINRKPKDQFWREYRPAPKAPKT